MCVRKLSLHDMAAAALWVLGLAFPIGHERWRPGPGGAEVGEEGHVEARAKAEKTSGIHSSSGGTRTANGGVSGGGSLGVSFVAGGQHEGGAAIAQMDPPALVLMRVLALPVIMTAILFVLAIISLIGSTLVATAGIASFR